MRVACWPLLVVAALVLAGCGQAQVSTLHLVAKDATKSYRVTRGSVIVVTIPSDRNVRWRYDPYFDDLRPRVRVLSHRWVPPATSRPGATGTEVWRFRATDKGKGGILLTYWDPRVESVREAAHALPAWSATLHVR